MRYEDHMTGTKIIERIDKINNILRNHKQIVVTLSTSKNEDDNLESTSVLLENELFSDTIIEALKKEKDDLDKKFKSL